MSCLTYGLFSVDADAEVTRQLTVLDPVYDAEEWQTAFEEYGLDPQAYYELLPDYELGQEYQGELVMIEYQSGNVIPLVADPENPEY